MVISAFSFAFAEDALVIDNDVAATETQQTEEQVANGESTEEADEPSLENDLSDGTDSELPQAETTEDVVKTPVKTQDETIESVPQKENVPEEAVKKQAVKTQKKTENKNTETNEFVPQTVSYTVPGPFMAPVPVGKKAKSRSINPGLDPDNNGLVTDKKAERQKDGTYKITMEAYTTGSVIKRTTPVDFVLVLDQSRSMTFSFDGKDDGTNGRQEALISSVNNFIDSVASQYSTSGDHRISLVKFGRDAEVLNDWIKADKAGAGILKNKISALVPDGNTDTELAMEKAENLMGSGYNYNGPNKERQKIVIVFTDGVPANPYQAYFDPEIANASVAIAKRIKSSGCTIYTVGIFNGANPAQLYGDKGFVHNSDGTEKSSWYNDARVGSTDVDPVDVPAGNRFLNYLSSNYDKANDTGLVKKYNAVNDPIGWRILKNYNRTAPADQDYYLSADNADKLDVIFKNISEHIETQDITLGPDTIVRDVVTPYFDMPVKQEIKVYTSTYDGNSFGERKPATGLNVKMEGSIVEVTGFDFNKNFVTETAKEDGTHGKKLIIEFSVTAKDLFLGGNRVPTNLDSSGVYSKDYKLVEAFEVPKVDVPLKPYIAAADPINIYLNGNVTDKNMADNSGIKFFGRSEFLELEEWQKEFVVFDETFSANVTNAKEDGSYTITGQLKPKYTGTEKDGPQVSATAAINVFKPEVTFKDLNGYYGDEVPDLKTAEAGTVWKHGLYSSDKVTMTGKEPVLTFKFNHNEKYIKSPEDIPVKVTTYIGKENVTNYTTYHHKVCVPPCDFNANTEQFLVHVKTCDLYITKAVQGKANGQKFTVTVTGDTNLGAKKLQVSVGAAGQVHIEGLPTGTYNIAEDAGWAGKRCKVTYSKDSTQLSATHSQDNIKITNSITDKWLNGFTEHENVFRSFAGKSAE